MSACERMKPGSGGGMDDLSSVGVDTTGVDVTLLGGPNGLPQICLWGGLPFFQLLNWHSLEKVGDQGVV